MRRAGGLMTAVIAIGVVSISASPVAAVPTERTSKRVAEGVRLVRLRYERGPVRAFVLRVVVGNRWSVDPALAGRALPSHASTLEIAKRAEALAAVNGDFGPGYPIRPFAIRGTLITSGSQGNVVAFASDDMRGYTGPPGLRIVASTGDSNVDVRAWNHGPPEPDQVVGFTPAGGLLEGPPSNACSVHLRADATSAKQRGLVTYAVSERECSMTAMDVRGGVVLSSRRAGAGARWLRSLTTGTSVTIRRTTRWADVDSMQGGHPRLVHRGDVVVPKRCETLFCLRQPRTGVGLGRGCVDNDERTRCVVMLVVVDGRRSDWSVGLRLVAFARLLRRIGAVEAVNMDGGGSTQMVVRGNVVNRPTDRPLREIPAAWVVERA